MLLETLWATLDDQGLKSKIKERPGMFLGARGYEGLQGMIIGGINAIAQAAGQLGKAHLKLRLNGEQILISICLNEEDDFLSWGKDRNVISFTNLAIIKNLSTTFKINVQNNQLEIIREYQEGHLELEQQKELILDERKIEIIFTPDYRLFGFKTLPYFIYYDYLQQLAILNSGLSVGLEEMNQQKNSFSYDHGLVTYLNKKDDYITRKGKPAYFQISYDNLTIEIAISRNDQTRISDSFANNEQTFSGGTHLEGFLDGAVTAINQFLEEQNSVGYYDESKFHSRFDFVVSVKVAVPKYFGVTKQKLRNPEVYQLVRDFTQKEFLAHLRRFPLWYRG